MARAAVDTAPKDPASHLTRLKEGYVLGKRYVRHHHNQRGTTWTTETLPKNGVPSSLDAQQPSQHSFECNGDAQACAKQFHR